ncbi:MAG: AraC family transcriptional regulator [Rhizobiaceae bacterium]|nr:AraC family transcriptional regulator [Rhizobiaceae bacterium]
MRPFLEKLPVFPDSSWSYLNRRLDDAIPFQWHHHPEYELTLTLNSRGQRFIGDHVGAYDDGDLVLVGPNLPHTWVSQEKLDAGQPHIALVLWFHPNWAVRLTEGFPEFRGVQALLARAGCGLKFSEPFAKTVRAEHEAIFDLAPAERTLSLLRILDRLAGDDAAVPLASLPVKQEGAPESRERIDRVITHIHMHYSEQISLAELADIAALSVSGLHRLFAKHMQTTVTDYVMRMRIGDASARLSGTDQPIQHIANAVGYGALSNFNRQFRALKAMSPREYRRLFR